MSLDDALKAETRKAFAEAVNMTPAALHSWLDSTESRALPRNGESRWGQGDGTVPRSGKLILALKRKKPANLTHADYVHMSDVVDMIRHQLAQRPAGNVEHSHWRYGLMNWGHDPLRSE